MAVRPKCDSLLFQGEAAWEFTEPQWEVWKNLLMDPSEDVEEKYVCTFFCQLLYNFLTSHTLFSVCHPLDFLPSNKFLNWLTAAWSVFVAYHAQCCKGSGNYPTIGTPSVVYVVKEVVRDEMPFRPNFPSADNAYNYRFATTKGGSHSAVGSTIAKEYMDELSKAELTRRHFVEALHTNPLMRTPAGAWISRSEKLEHGKTRALFACDSVNYLHFDAPCRAVERAWLNRRANLNPAGQGVATEYERRAARLGRYKVMFDFTDFNSAHTLESQKTVVREVFRGLNQEWLDWLERSIDWMWIRCHDDTWVRASGTLMSGHRLTSLINTVLNAAYTRIAMGVDVYSRVHVEHVGDDIVMSTCDERLLSKAVTAMLHSGLRLQAEKQSCGEINAEFLRCCYNMRGRGAIPVDWGDEMQKRTNPDVQKELFAPFTPTQIEAAVKEVVRNSLDRAGYDGSFFRSIYQADIEHYGSIIRWRGGLGEFLCNSGGYSYIITYATPVVCRRDYGPCMVMQAIISQVRTCGIGWCFLKDGDYHFYTEDEVEEILVSVGRSPSPSGEGDEHGASSPEPPRTPEPFIREHRGRLRERPKRKRWSSLYHTNF